VTVRTTRRRVLDADETTICRFAADFAFRDGESLTPGVSFLEGDSFLTTVVEVLVTRDRPRGDVTTEVVVDVDLLTRAKRLERRGVVC
jgi:hypothetical protein